MFDIKNLPDKLYFFLLDVIKTMLGGKNIIFRFGLLYGV